MARKKATAGETEAPKKRASRKKASAAAPEADLEVTEVSDDGNVEEAEHSPGEVLADAEPEPEPKKTKATASSRRKEKAPPVRTESAIEALIPTVSLALVDANSSLPAQEAVAEAFTAFYAEALERMRYALEMAAEPPPPPAPLVADAPPPLVFDVPVDEGVAASSDWELAVEEPFDALPPADEAADDAAPSVFGEADEGAFAEAFEQGAAVEEDTGAAGVLFDEAGVMPEPAPPEPEEEADEATVNFDPSDLVALIDADEAPASEEAVVVAEDAVVVEVEAEEQSADGDGEEEGGAAAEAPPAEAAAAPRKSRKSKRKR